MSRKTILLTLEGHLQSWGDHQSKFIVRQTNSMPTKSGVLGLLCAALGVSRKEAQTNWLPKLRGLKMACRADRPGMRIWDYHTVGAKLSLHRADGKSRTDPLVTCREYLCDASFLVLLQGSPILIDQLAQALERPVWPLYLGRKNCPPSRPILAGITDSDADLLSILRSVPWRPRIEGEQAPSFLVCSLEFDHAYENDPCIYASTVVYDSPVSFEMPSHEARVVLHAALPVGAENGVPLATKPLQRKIPPPPRPRADYSDSRYKEARVQRMKSDHGLCVFCKSTADSVHHVSYKRAGGEEIPGDLRSVCRLCHDALTMIEYGIGATMDRVNPEDPRWRDLIIQKRQEILRFRSLKTQKRARSMAESE
ncbi:MAG TPA: type I-E CRISPR-associated protein Cas5/CasD [Candidatus Hydrogenedentes bacterium]|nr:type I-E CRISPR-associated protein Cas5/CasD [Candidatus Hydrogenedentota bacterium]HOL75724.1 type I-E CRISPR-associated protein Cas5/CasD [Candidatus Hydrogenedentota bacterium]HPO84283.1 type I-E CRISPR-associated protein Cas5/CasD [Candidatus Hydrogenedentota bacterium]